MIDQADKTAQTPSIWTGAFLLSSWREADSRRFVIVNVYTQERHAFATLEQMQQFLLRELAAHRLQC